MPRKTIESKGVVIFVVEGSSDKEALEKIFQAIYRNKHIVFKFTDGDVTSDNEIGKENVCDVIYEKVSSFMKDKKLKKSDIWQIVHIFDTDGAYTPPSAAVQGTTSNFIYSQTQISCKDVQKILDRNKKKSALMDYLLTQNEIKGISYTCYYMSSNLDHALYNEQNLAKEKKGAYADAFYAEFAGKEKLFIGFLEDEAANGVANTFPSSWRYIKQGLHSLERHTNLHFYFKQNPYQ